MDNSNVGKALNCENSLYTPRRFVIGNSNLTKGLNDGFGLSNKINSTELSQSSFTASTGVSPTNYFADSFSEKNTSSGQKNEYVAVTDIGNDYKVGNYSDWECREVRRGVPRLAQINRIIGQPVNLGSQPYSTRNLNRVDYSRNLKSFRKIPLETAPEVNKVRFRFSDKNDEYSSPRSGDMSQEIHDQYPYSYIIRENQVRNDELQYNKTPGCAMFLENAVKSCISTTDTSRNVSVYPVSPQQSYYYCDEVTPSQPIGRANKRSTGDDLWDIAAGAKKFVCTAFGACCQIASLFDFDSADKKKLTAKPSNLKTVNSSVVVQCNDCGEILSVDPSLLIPAQNDTYHIIGA